MSQATDLVYAMAAAYNSHDVARICALCTEDVEIWTYLEGMTEGEPYRGYDGVREWQRNEADTWERLEVIDPRARDLGEGRVLGLAAVKGRGRGSGLEVEAEPAWIFSIRESRIARIDVFADPDQALEAAGLSE